MKGRDFLSAFRRNRRLHALLLLLLDAILFLLIYLNKDVLVQQHRYQMESVSEMRYGQGGHTLVIDNGKKTLLVLDGDGRLIRRFESGSREGGFIYACHAAEKPDGSIYLADIEYGNRGNLLDRERILRLWKGKVQTVYEVDYSMESLRDIPLQYGSILELQEYDGSIYFVRVEAGAAVVYRLDEGDQPVMVGSAELDGDLNDAAYDVSLGCLILSYRTGEIVQERLDSGETGVIWQNNAQIIWDVASRNGEVYCTEVIGKTIWHYSIGGSATPEIAFRSPNVLFKLDVSKDGGKVLATDYAGFFSFSREGGKLLEEGYVNEAELDYFYKVLLLRATAVLAGLILLFLVFLAGRKLFRIITISEKALRVLYIVIASFSVAFILSYSLLNQILDTSMNASEKQVRLFAEMLLSDINVDKLRNISRPGDYQNDDYNEVKAALDRYVWNSYVKGDYYYYIISRGGGGTISAIMDFEETAPCWNPVYEYGVEPYTSVLENGEEVTYSENSAYGAWTFVLLPVRDSQGNIVAELEVGQSLDAINARQQRLIIDLLINVAISTTVLTMLLLELSFLLAFIENKNEAEGHRALDPTEQAPVRTLIFFSYMADSMQDAFIAVLLQNLYNGELPIARGVAIALPMSLQLFAMAVFSIFGGKLAGRYGAKNALLTGFASELSGFLLCFLTGSYIGVLLGKLLIGTGMGIIYVSCNTVASMAKDEKYTEEAFAGVSAGVLSGITIGAGMSSIMLSMGGYRLIYLLGSGLLTFGLLIVLGIVPRGIRGKVVESETARSGKVSTISFLTGRRILGFFLFLLIPFMMALSFREYFFPLYASEHGITEVQIANIYLLCGLMVLYIGPGISKWLIHKYGPTVSVTTASALLILDMGIFLVVPRIEIVFFCVVMLSFIVSFAYTCQYTYFDSLHEINDYGNGAAMGIYSMMESIGQTLGPIIYGAVLSLGYRAGIFVFAACMAGALMLFLLMRREKKGNAPNTVLTMPDA